MGEKERMYLQKGETVTVSQRTRLMHQLHRSNHPRYTLGHAKPLRAGQTTNSVARPREEGVSVVWGEGKRTEGDTVLWH
ncbi:hypothetical protein AAC387_Pa08g1608 [Persea americana]